MDTLSLTMESVRKQPRNTSIELLRFAFMFLIVLLHVYAHGTEHDYQQIYDWGKNMDTAFHLSLFSIGKIGVTDLCLSQVIMEYIPIATKL